MLLHEIGGILWLTLWRCWLHGCGMFSLLVEYGLVHRGDRINCETCYLFWSGFCVAEFWARRLSLYLACKPFPGLCACTRIGRRCASVVVIRSLSLFTNRADRHSQISSLDYWCATLHLDSWWRCLQPDMLCWSVTVTCCNALSNLTRLEPVSLWLTSSRSRHGPRCHPCHYPSRCVLKWICCNDYLTLPV